MNMAINDLEFNSSIPSGKRAETIHQQWQKLFNEASSRQPAVIIFDDLEHIAGAASGPEQEMSGEAQYCARIAQG